MSTSRQWRDVVSILRVRCDAIDLDYLAEVALQVDLSALLEDAMRAAD
jgi:hypothetical protein